MGITNTNKVVATITNLIKVFSGDTWATITTTWASETRTWAGLGSSMNNTSKPSGSITNTVRPV